MSERQVHRASVVDREIELFQTILKTYSERRDREDYSHRTAVDALLQSLSTVARAERFAAWVEQEAKSSLYFDHAFHSIGKGNDMFLCQMFRANWKTGGEALNRVNSRLRYSGKDKADNYIPIGAYGGSWLALSVDNKAMVPCETNYKFLEENNVTVVNSNNVVAVRFDVLVGQETLIVAQLGNIMSSDIQERETRVDNINEFLGTPPGPWRDTGYVLALRIEESGKGREVYVIRNLTSQNDWEIITDDEIKDDPSLLRMCGESDGYTVAELVHDCQDHCREFSHLCSGALKQSWDWVDRVDGDVRLEAISRSRPQIFETGFVKDGDGRRLVALAAA